jgi:hypothetical protein
MCVHILMRGVWCLRGFPDAKTQRGKKKGGRDRKSRPAANSKSRRAIRKTKAASEQAHGTRTIQTADQINTWVSWFRSELVAVLSHESHRQQFLSSASARNFCLKKHSPSPKTPSRSAAYEPIHPASSGVLDNVDAHTLARSEVRFATEKCRVPAVELCQLRGHQAPV